MMLKENAQPHIYHKKPLLHKVFGKKIGKMGLMTNYGVQYLQDRLIMEGNHNLLFGTVNNSPIGICHDNRLANRNLNTMVLTNGGVKGWYNHVLPNVLAMHSSAVVVGDKKFYDRMPELIEKGCNVFIMDFGNGEITNRFNPFTPSGVHRAGHKTTYFFNLADTVDRIFFNADNMTEIRHQVLKLVFLYIGLSEDLSDNQRNFQTVYDVLNDLLDNRLTTIEKYVVEDTFGYSSDSVKTLVETDKKLLEAVLTEIMFGLLSLKTNKVFQQSDVPQLNISIERFINEQSYIFIPVPLSLYHKETAFLIQMLLTELYDYADANWKHSWQALDKTVHFYLTMANAYPFPDLVKFMATDRPYGIGISVVGDLNGLRAAYGISNFELLYDNSDTHLFLGFRERDEADSVAFIQKEMPVYVDANGKEVPHGSKKGTMHPARIPALSETDLCKLFAEEKAIVIIRDFCPIICDVLKPPDKTIN